MDLLKTLVMALVYLAAGGHHALAGLAGDTGAGPWTDLAMAAGSAAMTAAGALLLVAGLALRLPTPGGSLVRC